MTSPVAINQTLPITVKQARKLLGKDFSKFSDDEVDRVILLLDVIAQDIVASSVPDQKFNT
jgi:hypothetical protein